MKPIIPVIYYHSVAEKKNPKWVRNNLTLELKYFLDLLYFLEHRKIQTLTIKEWYEINTYHQKLDRPSICITFDDGYLDNWIYVFPILQKFRMKATVFVSPEFVDKNTSPRKNLSDYWKGESSQNELKSLGFLNWEEMRIMEQSGLIDIQSHTQTHTKYYVSDELVEFHHPRIHNIYPLCNQDPTVKPYYMSNDHFEQLLPYGSPIFEQKSSIISRKVTINPEFNTVVVERLSKLGLLEQYDFQKYYSAIQEIYSSYKKADSLILSKESEHDYLIRLRQELAISKNIIEKEIEKEVRFLCWPHGDCDKLTHHEAIKVGYFATSAGKMKVTDDQYYRFNRFGHSPLLNNRFLTRFKSKLKIQAELNRFPFKQIFKTYRLVK